MLLQDIKLLRTAERLLRTNQAKDEAEMVADIYKVGPLTYPKYFSAIMAANSKERLLRY